MPAERPPSQSLSWALPRSEADVAPDPLTNVARPRWVPDLGDGPLDPNAPQRRSAFYRHPVSEVARASARSPHQSQCTKSGSLPASGVSPPLGAISPLVRNSCASSGTPTTSQRTLGNFRKNAIPRVMAVDRAYVQQNKSPRQWFGIVIPGNRPSMGGWRLPGRARVVGAAGRRAGRQSAPGAMG